ncbi:hypothetical protein IEQ34_019730 [Dendrobium chrysotoxum]|uniref:Uncharacterized protein n=1 Tax=Dendrobium chrysotoxum TaxID=161865 RepID=A0AAV7G7M8_DENCH|nr:hypothetical protein IEQ34_019730 [Dendrobium chrysotoxum]
MTLPSSSFDDVPLRPRPCRSLCVGNFLPLAFFTPFAPVLGREPTLVELYSHTHKRQEDQQWVDKHVRRAYEEYTRLRESQAAAGEGSSTGSTDYFNYHTWS